MFRLFDELIYCLLMAVALYVPIFIGVWLMVALVQFLADLAGG